tara:strand:- start:308 stop:436 length:129 start_codon:yes stop_codon:yes gene_type:complete
MTLIVNQACIAAKIIDARKDAGHLASLDVGMSGFVTRKAGSV